MNDDFDYKLTAHELRTINPEWTDTMVMDYMNRDIAAKNTSDSLSGHIGNTDNPHSVTFLILPDTPESYEGQAGMFAVVNAEETSVVFEDAPRDGKQYGREDGEWTQILNSVIQGIWLWSDVTSGDPGTGNMSSNNGQLAGIAELSVSHTTANGEQIPPVLLYQPGDSILVLDEDRNAYGRYEVVTTVDQGTYQEFGVITNVGVGNPQTGNVMDVAYIPQ